MYHFNYFYNDWIDISNIFDDAKKFAGQDLYELPVFLDEIFFKNLKFDTESLKNYRIDAAKKASKALGENPALCFSGGIDSQAMLLSWLESDSNFTVYTLVFNNDLNIQDVEHARMFCQQNNVQLNEIPFNIKFFLQTENYDYGIKYRCASPHFNTHFKMFDLIRKKGHTGICCGGDVPVKIKDVWGKNFVRNPHNFITYSKMNEYPVIGNFLSYYPELCWAIALLTKPLDWTKKPIGTFPDSPSDIPEAKIRYKDKCASYKQAGFNIIPQKEKYTGFELVKLEYERISGNGWTFETKFRHILESVLQHDPFKNSKMIFNERALNELEFISRHLQQET